MVTVNAMLERVLMLNVQDVSDKSFTETSEDYVKANTDQMYDGKLSTGDDITPSYQDDPYFKSRESAQRYSDWKDAITPSPKRKKGTPNLFINGKFHRSITMRVSGDSLNIRSDFYKADAIERKFSEKIYGLNKDSRVKYIAQSFLPALKKRVTNITKLKFS